MLEWLRSGLAHQGRGPPAPLVQDPPTILRPVMGVGTYRPSEVLARKGRFEMSKIWLRRWTTQLYGGNDREGGMTSVDILKNYFSGFFRGQQRRKGCSKALRSPQEDAGGSPVFGRILYVCGAKIFSIFHFWYDSGWHTPPAIIRPEK